MKNKLALLRIIFLGYLSSYCCNRILADNENRASPLMMMHKGKLEEKPSSASKTEEQRRRASAVTRASNLDPQRGDLSATGDKKQESLSKAKAQEGEESVQKNPLLVDRLREEGSEQLPLTLTDFAQAPILYPNATSFFLKQRENGIIAVVGRESSSSSSSSTPPANDPARTLENFGTALAFKELLGRERPDIYTEDLFRYSFLHQDLTPERLRYILALVNDPARNLTKYLQANALQSKELPITAEQTQELLQFLNNIKSNVVAQNVSEENATELSYQISEVQKCMAEFWQRKKLLERENLNELLQRAPSSSSADIANRPITTVANLLMEYGNSFLEIGKNFITLHRYDEILDAAEEVLNSFYKKRGGNIVFLRSETDLGATALEIEQRGDNRLAPPNVAMPSLQEIFPNAKLLGREEKEVLATGERIQESVFRVNDFKYSCLREKEVFDATPQLLERTFVVGDRLLLALNNGVNPNVFFQTLKSLFPEAELTFTKDPAYYVVQFQSRTLGTGLSLDFFTRLEETIEAYEKPEQGSLVRVSGPICLSYGPLESIFHPNDQHYRHQWGLKTILAPEAWEIRSSANDIPIAVLDTGVRYDHEDLNMWRNLNPLVGEHPHGWNTDDSNNNDPTDRDGHGTHCAGIIGALGDNGRGISGVVWGAKLMACKVLSDNGSIKDQSSIIRGIKYAMDHGARILNCSLGKLTYDRVLYKMLEQARDQGVIVVCAAGNSRDNNNSPLNLDHDHEYPASYAVTHDAMRKGQREQVAGLNNIVVVAATTRLNQLANFSYYGVNAVHLAAPGDQIYSTLATHRSAYGNKNGTSMAAPHVTGALALMMAEFPHLAYQALIDQLCSRVTKDPALTATIRTGGILNVADALVRPAPGPLPVLSQSISAPFQNRWGAAQAHWRDFSNSVNAFINHPNLFDMNAADRSLPWVAYGAWLPNLIEGSKFIKFVSYIQGVKDAIPHIDTVAHWTYKACYNAHKASMGHPFPWDRVFATKKACLSAAIAYNATLDAPYNESFRRQDLLKVAQAAWRAAEFAEAIDHWRNPVSWLKRVAQESRQLSDTIAPPQAAPLQAAPLINNPDEQLRAERNAQRAANFFLRTVQQYHDNNRNHSKLIQAHMAMARVIDMMRLQLQPFTTYSTQRDPRNRLDASYPRLDQGFWRDDDELKNRMIQQTQAFAQTVEAWYHQELQALGIDPNNITWWQRLYHDL